MLIKKRLNSKLLIVMYSMHHLRLIIKRSLNNHGISMEGLRGIQKESPGVLLAIAGRKRAYRRRR